MHNKHTLFASSTKMADIILENYALLTVLPRFGIRLGFGERSIAEVCRLHGVNEQFFIPVSNVYTFDEYLPDETGIANLDVESLITYLQQSHSYYICTKIRSIEQQLEAMTDAHQERDSRIIRSFFDEYKNEILNHFRYEEQQVFPYIKALSLGENAGDFHIHQYELNHSNIEDKLGDLKNIIIKYLPEGYSSELRNNVLLEIFLFEEELIKHTLIEEKVLVPFVSQMEKSYE